MTAHKPTIAVYLGGCLDSKVEERDHYPQKLLVACPRKVLPAYDVATSGQLFAPLKEETYTRIDWRFEDNKVVAMYVLDTKEDMLTTLLKRLQELHDLRKEVAQYR